MTETGDEVSEGQVPTRTDEIWLEEGQNLIKKSSESLEGAAKAIIALITSLITIYTVLLSYFGSINNISSNPYFYILTIPIVFFFLSIWLCVEVYSPKIYEIETDKPERIKEKIVQINKEKYESFRYGKIFL